MLIYSINARLRYNTIKVVSSKGWGGYQRSSRSTRGRLPLQRRGTDCPRTSVPLVRPTWSPWRAPRTTPACPSSRRALRPRRVFRRARTTSAASTSRARCCARGSGARTPYTRPPWTARTSATSTSYCPSLVPRPCCTGGRGGG